jgi:proteasome maturation protein
MAEPIRREMELKIVRGQDFRPTLLGGSDGVAGDVLEGRDTVMDWEDVFGGHDAAAGLLEERGGVAREVEGRLGIKF